MNKKVFIVFILILVGLASTFFLIVSYNLNNNQDYVQSYCSSWAERKNIVIPACEGNWSYIEGECHFKCEISDGSLIGGCAGVSLENRQECCDNWATENGIAHTMCVGEWIIDENSSCAWECFEG